MTRFFRYLIIWPILSLSSGCSIQTAWNQPPVIPMEKVHVGISRAELISVLGVPSHTEIDERVKTDYFQFVDGYHTKARIIIYLVGDFFTIGIAEVFFWPIEQELFSGSKTGKATATYDKNNIVKTITITNRYGDPWE